MATTYTLITSNVLGSNTASVTFSSIPQTYTDLVLISSVRSSRTPAGVRDEYKILINGTTSNYSSLTVNADGSGTATGVASSSGSYLSGGWANTDNMTSSMFSIHEVYFPQYTASVNKPIATHSAQASQPSPFYLTSISSTWANTAAITSLSMYPETGPNWITGSSFYLYGIKNS